ncbi:hypothetical protein RIF29_00493 [Crotalaria pallida]|uniref:Uncharacterized protein n=1 Tax=Crotalaria pallida TaxID=3830 RepID=A0AAN9P6L7_CROPI
MLEKSSELNPLLGFIDKENATTQATSQEVDLKERSMKKIKHSDQNIHEQFSSNSTHPVSGPVTNDKEESHARVLQYKEILLNDEEKQDGSMAEDRHSNMETNNSGGNAIIQDDVIQTDQAVITVYNPANKGTVNVENNKMSKDQGGISYYKAKGDSNAFRQIEGNGSRYSSLATDQDVTDNQIDAQSQQNFGHMAQQQSESRVRNSSAGKISLQKKNLGLGPKIKPSRYPQPAVNGKAVTSPNSSSAVVGTKQDSTGEEKSQKEEKQKEALHLMKIMSKQKPDLLNQMSIEVVLPSAEPINFAHQQALLRNSNSSSSRPPDLMRKQMDMEVDKIHPGTEKDCKMDEVSTLQKG